MKPAAEAIEGNASRATIVATAPMIHLVLIAAPLAKGLIPWELGSAALASKGCHHHCVPSRQHHHVRSPECAARRTSELLRLSPDRETDVFVSRHSGKS